MTAMHSTSAATLFPDGQPHIVVVGGGISGMSAAYELGRATRDGAPPVMVTLIEREARLGGKVVTERNGPFVIEGGPDSFMAQKPWAAELAREIGLGDELMVASPMRRTTWVLIRGRPQPLPEGMLLIVPTRIAPFAFSPLISPLGKLRMALDLFVPARRDDGDETLADFIRRRLGNEALDRLAEPILSGIHSAECERQSILATFPRFRELEKRHGSLIRGMLAARRTASPSSAHQSPFMTLRGGMGTLVERLEQRLTARILTNRRVMALTCDTTAARPYRLWLDDGATLDADAVILATPSYAAADLVGASFPALADALRAVRYVSTATVSMVYRRSEVGTPLDGYGLVIPRSEQTWINACTLSSVKFRHRAPDEYLLLRCFVGGSRRPELLARDDDDLVRLAQSDLRAVLGITAAPLLTRVYRWHNGNPQYDVGHLERIAALEALCPAGLLLAGAAYRGVGVPDCIKQGREAARRALDVVATARYPVMEK
ncbi:protoporphyrinogen oxidase [Roseiflexus sp.]|uniref:protoporphyrinogen oxidase n=1 Tax=Roseiflexus sp. TaxID=2562120 RepID=UPI0021DC553E|nr:protoporphyrinogen oxidase [Roseiflexus sp.]GIW01023.1 MAG: protoporphyrinogen oxidase [Roseiflexus sp.]